MAGAIFSANLRQFLYPFRMNRWFICNKFQPQVSLFVSLTLLLSLLRYNLSNIPIAFIIYITINSNKVVYCNSNIANKIFFSLVAANTFLTRSFNISFHFPLHLSFCINFLTNVCNFACIYHCMLKWR